MSHTRVTVAVLTAATLAASGCGQSGSAKTLSRAELIAKAEAICVRANAKLKLLERTKAATGLLEAGEYEQTATVELGKLTPPASMASDWREIVAADQTLARDTVKYAEYNKLHNRRELRLLIRAAGEVDHPMSATAKRDGLNECAEFA